SRASVAEMIQGIDDSAKKFGYTIRLFINTDPKLEQDLWGEVIASSVDGILLMNDELTPETIEEIKHTPVPVVFVNQLSPSDEFGSVGINYEECAYRITKLMIERGNKDIMFIATEHKYTVNEMKQSGYIRAMKEVGMEPNVFYTSGDININEKHFSELLDQKVPDVALVVRDSIAISFMNVAQKQGIKIPDQLQVIGFQNTKYAELSYPKLTCVETPIYEIGNKAMAYLTELMTTDNYDKQKPNILIDYNIVWRQSTK
ncbi:MAG: substrate-binding domain-containing protein, partial [Acholeplasmataceae bacterium]|nr:substrate-binding domain-containing protein [Acholeplasmataceae bacterium]